MKNALTYILIGICIVLGAILWWNASHKEKPKEPIIQVLENTYKSDSLQMCINALNLKIDSTSKLIKSRERVITLQRATITDVVSYADSLELAYNNQKTIDRCDSVIAAKNKVISEKDTLIDELDAEAQEYSRQVFQLTDKADKQSQLIKEKDIQIDNLSCTVNWKVRHKFWAWLLGYKCKK